MASSAEKLSRSAPTIRARRSRAASGVAGRPSAVERLVGLGCDIAQHQVDVERRRKDLGGDAGWDSPDWKLGRQCANRSSAHARVNQLAGLKPFRVGSPLGGNSPRVERDQIGRGRADVDQETRASQAPGGLRASQAPASSPRRQSADLREHRRPSGIRRRSPRRTPRDRAAPRLPRQGWPVPRRPWSDNNRRARRSWSRRPVRKAEAPPRHPRSPEPARRAASRPQTGSKRPVRQLCATLMLAPPISRAMQEVCFAMDGLFINSFVPALR